MAAGEDIAPRVATLHTVMADQSVPEWQSVLTAVQELDHVGPGPIGYLGVSMGSGLGIPFLAAEPRVRAAVLGLAGSVGLTEAAAQLTIPIQFLVQWDDALVPRTQALDLFDTFASPAKTLDANPGDVPRFETDNALRFFTRNFTD